MKFSIDGNVIDLLAVDEFTQHETLLMAKAGMGLQTWIRTMSQIGRLARDEDGESVIVLSKAEAEKAPARVDLDLFFDSPRHLLAIIIATWLGRRHSGSPGLSFEESAQIPWARLEPVIDDDDDEEAREPEDDGPDPTPPSGSAPVSDGAAATSTATSKASTTRKRTSTRTSST